MRLLFDQNLSRRLVPLLDAEFPDSCHVSDLGLETATDQEIWSYAADHGYVIVSKDSDFRQLAFLHGPPPKAIWVRRGNASTHEIFGLLLDYSSVISHFGDRDEEALLVIP
ncbi:MAG: DUF5615 family PIN-like protein [bacterium]|nr:DUF5615 family PIN-like protein [bacterium]